VERVALRHGLLDVGAAHARRDGERDLALREGVLPVVALGDDGGLVRDRKVDLVLERGHSLRRVEGGLGEVGREE
jgi:hypothetical protein